MAQEGPRSGGVSSQVLELADGGEEEPAEAARQRRATCARGAAVEETDGERIRLARVGGVASGCGRGGHPVRADGIERPGSDYCC